MLVSLPTSTDGPVYGPRGQRPFLIPCDPGTASYLVRAVPGVAARRGSVLCAYDSRALVQVALGQVGVTDPPAPVTPPAGLDEYLAKFASKLRGYQKEMVRFLLLRSMALNADVMRSGKTPTTIAAAVASGARKVLIIGPAIARLVWADEIAKWVGDSALLLDGRAADRARWYCIECRASGRTPEGKWCPACKNRAGTSHGFRAVTDVRAAIAEARWVIVNYDLLVPQGQIDDTGKRMLRDDLRGWAQVLADVPWDVVVPDEAHMLRGRPNPRRKGQTRRDAFLTAATRAKRVWAVTGTPLYGRTADLWGLLDAITDGLFGRPFYAFDERYAAGHKGQYGWEAKGQSNPDELRLRLGHYMLKRDRSQILADMPAKVRQVVRIDKDVKHTKASGARVATKRATGANALRATVTTKLPDVVDNVTAELAEGGKTIVFAYLKDNLDDIAEAITKATETGELAPALTARQVRLWKVNGETPPETRVAMARAFREWDGAGVFVATIDSVQVAVSLKGATSVHFADLHHDPSAILQAEDRANEPGTRGVTVLYYVVANSFDEHVLNTLLLPKMEQIERMVGDEGAGGFRQSFGEDPEVALESCWERLSKAADKALA